MVYWLLKISNPSHPQQLGSELSCPEVSSSARAESLSDISIHLPSIQKLCIDFWRYWAIHIPNNWGVSSDGPEVSSSARAESLNDISINQLSIQKFIGIIEYIKPITSPTTRDWAQFIRRLALFLELNHSVTYSYTHHQYRNGVLII